MSKSYLGTTAPAWKLDDQNENPIDVNHYRGKSIILMSFHPLAWTPVCTEQMRGLERKYDELKAHNAIAFGLSVDSVPCKKAWSEAIRIANTIMPSDFWPHGGVAQMYDVFNSEDGVSRRSAIIIDLEGKIAFRKIYPPSQVPDIEEQLEVIKKLQRQTVGV